MSALPIVACLRLCAVRLVLCHSRPGAVSRSVSSSTSTCLVPLPSLTSEILLINEIFFQGQPFVTFLGGLYITWEAGHFPHFASSGHLDHTFWVDGQT